MAAFQNELQHYKSLKNNNIGRVFHFSKSTARPMCAELKRNGSTVRTFGGIQSLPEQYKNSYQSYFLKL